MLDLRESQSVRKLGQDLSGSDLEGKIYNSLRGVLCFISSLWGVLKEFGPSQWQRLFWPSHSGSLGALPLAERFRGPQSGGPGGMLERVEDRRVDRSKSWSKTVETEPVKLPWCTKGIVLRLLTLVDRNLLAWDFWGHVASGVIGWQHSERRFNLYAYIFFWWWVFFFQSWKRTNHEVEVLLLFSSRFYAFPHLSQPGLRGLSGCRQAGGGWCRAGNAWGGPCTIARGLELCIVHAGAMDLVASTCGPCNLFTSSILYQWIWSRYKSSM